MEGVIKGPVRHPAGFLM